jgi:hypothetical protein
MDRGGQMFYRVVLFIIFSILAAPLEYHIKWAEPWVKGEASFFEAVERPLVSGMLFFYSVIITVEALMHLAAYPQVATRLAVRLIKLCGYPLSIVPFFLYILRGLHEPLDDGWLTFQWCVAATSLLLAVIIHTYTAKIDMRLR